MYIIIMQIKVQNCGDRKLFSAPPNLQPERDKLSTGETPLAPCAPTWSLTAQAPKQQEGEAGARRGTVQEQGKCSNAAVVTAMWRSLLPTSVCRDQTLSLWSGSTDSKNLAYQRTNLREYQRENSHKGNHLNQDLASLNHPQHTVQDTHLNNKQDKNANPIISRQEYHLTQPCPSEGKQANKQKLSTNLTLYEGHTNHWTNFRREETKRKKGSRK